jgi:chromate transporter
MKFLCDAAQRASRLRIFSGPVCRFGAYRRPLLRLTLSPARCGSFRDRRCQRSSRVERSLASRYWESFFSFLKAGSLTFGSGLVIVPFLEKGLVQNTGWLNERQFLVAVAIGIWRGLNSSRISNDVVMNSRVVRLEESLIRAR